MLSQTVSGALSSGRDTPSDQNETQLVNQANDIHQQARQMAIDLHNQMLDAIALPNADSQVSYSPKSK